MNAIASLTNYRNIFPGMVFKIHEAKAISDVWA